MFGIEPIRLSSWNRKNLESRALLTKRTVVRYFQRHNTALECSPRFLTVKYRGDSDPWKRSILKDHRFGSSEVEVSYTAPNGLFFFSLSLYVRHDTWIGISLVFATCNRCSESIEYRLKLTNHL